MSQRVAVTVSYSYSYSYSYSTDHIISEKAKDDSTDTQKREQIRNRGGRHVG